MKPHLWAAIRRGVQVATTASIGGFQRDLPAMLADHFVGFAVTSSE